MRLRKMLENYIALRESLGYEVRYSSTPLKQFVAYVERQGASAISTRLALRWVQRQRPGAARRKYSMIRVFAKYASAIDPRTVVPQAGILGTKHRLRPHIFTDEEISRLLDEATRRGRETPRGTHNCFFGLLATTGLRRGEAMRLKIDHIDFENGILNIYNTKFGKSRLVPIHPSTTKMLKTYKAVRDKLPAARLSPYFFVNRSGNRLHAPALHLSFQQLVQHADVTNRGAMKRPRIHDLRHTFAVRSLIEWYKTDQNIEANLPVLSTYLGHTKVRDTYWYLSQHPELLKLAVSKLDARWEHA